MGTRGTRNPLRMNRMIKKQFSNSGHDWLFMTEFCQFAQAPEGEEIPLDSAGLINLHYKYYLTELKINTRIFEQFSPEERTQKLNALLQDLASHKCIDDFKSSSTDIDQRGVVTTEGPDLYERIYWFDYPSEETPKDGQDAGGSLE